MTGETKSCWNVDVLTLYPEMFPGSLGLALAGKALAKGLWSLQTTQIRDFALDKHRSVDDTPSGGGPGMVLRADVVASALESVIQKNDARPRLYMSPRGKPLTQQKVHELKDAGGAIILCGRFEGVDQRVIDASEFEEISVGDYILSGGEIAAMMLMDAAIRLLPGVMGKKSSGEDESFESGLLEYPHYTRPSEWNGLIIPEILTSGHHQKIRDWRLEQSLSLTKQRRPDLFENYQQQSTRK